MKRAVKLSGRLLTVLLGLFILAFGVVLYIKAGLGLDAFSVFGAGLANTLHISMGRALQLWLLALLAILCFIDRNLLGVGTVMHGVMVGFFVDLLLSVPLPAAQNAAAAYALLILGICCTGCGLAIYLSANLGAGVMDAIMLIIRRKTGMSVKKIKLGIDFVLALLGFMLGGTIGVGTALGVLLTGTIVQAMLRALNSQPQKSSSQSM